MIQDKVLYTDGKAVTVTDSRFQVRNTEYLLNGITKHGMFVIRPHRIPGVIILLLGVALMAVGILNLIPADKIADVRMGDTYVTANTIALFGGAILSLIGVLVIGLVKERYAVRIATAEGEKNVVVSDQKEYIRQITDALSSAFNFLRGTTHATFVRRRR